MTCSVPRPWLPAGLRVGHGQRLRPRVGAGWPAPDADSESESRGAAWHPSHGPASGAARSALRRRAKCAGRNKTRARAARRRPKPGPRGAGPLCGRALGSKVGARARRPSAAPQTCWPSLSKRAVHASGAGPEPAPAMPAPREARGRAQREAERRPKPTGRARKAARVTNDTELETLQDCLRITTVSRERRRKPANGRARQPPARAASLHARGPTAGHAQARLASTA